VALILATIGCGVFGGAMINATINEILQSPETRAVLANLNVLLRPGTPQDFVAYMARETPAWSEMARQSGATAH